MSDSASSDALPAPGLRPAGAPPDAARLRRDLELLYQSHCGKVAGYFRRCGVNEAVAIELAQDTFVQALRGLAQFQGHSKLSTWLWTIARNVLLGHLRAARPVGAEADGEPVDPDTLMSPAGAHLNSIGDCVRRGFAVFSREHPERAEVVYLAVVEGWTREELAAYLGRTPHAATEYLSQCKARLRPYIEGCDEA